MNPPSTKPTLTSHSDRSTGSNTPRVGKHWFQSQVVGISRDGWTVYDRPHSHHHLEPDLLIEVLDRLTLGGKPFVTGTADFERIVAATDCISTLDGDDIVYARREGRKGLTRFVHGRPPELTTFATAVLKRMGDVSNGYLLITAFPGLCAAPEPWDHNATPASRPFWASHALVWGSCPIVPGTETTICPW